MKKHILFLGGLLLASSTFAQSQWISLFDGTTLEGWTKRGGQATYEVMDGAIVGTNGPGHNTFLCSDRTFSDFELEFDVKLFAPINSGVQIRSLHKMGEKRGKHVEIVYGPQVEIEEGPAEAGYIYGESLGGGWLTPKDKLIPHDAFQNGKWNHYRIVARGPRIQTYINGRQISDLVREDIYKTHTEGVIGLQVHSSPEETGTQKIAWKNIRIRPIEHDGWVSLFDGKTMDGWIPKIRGHKLGENPMDTFQVEAGVLKVSYDQYGEFQDRFGHLFYEKPYSDYIFRMEYRFVGNQAKGGKGWAYRNSGVMIHGQSPESMELDQKFPTSIEVQLLGADEGKVRTTGNLCTPGTKFYQHDRLMERHCYTSVSPSLAGDQWVQIEIHVFGGNEIVHYINGHEVMRYQNPVYDDGTPMTGGSISLQAESHPCEFRYIEIKPLN